MGTVLNGVSYVMAYKDDIIVVSTSADEHCAYLEEFLIRIQSCGFYFQMEKVHILVTAYQQPRQNNR